MLILKITGLALLAAGFLLGIFSFISAKRTDFFTEIAELRRIRETGYIKEHKEERREDVYRRDPAEERSRIMSRRAKRVLERMGEEEPSAEKPKGIAKGTSLLEEVPPAPPMEAKKISAPAVSLKDNSSDDIPSALAGLGTDILPSEETAPLIDASGTDILPSRDEEGTAILGDEEGTAVLDAEEGTAVLSDQEGTAVLKDEEGTAVLEEGTAVLDSEGTAVLEEEGKAVLEDADEEGTARLERS